MASLLLFAVGGLFAQNNIKKTAAVPYTQGPPTFTPNTSVSSEIAIDTITGKIYQWHRTTGAWLMIGQGIDVISGSIAPAYTPARNQSIFAINAVDSLYRYRSGSWRHLNGGGAGGDDWGSDVVNHDATLTGNGTSGTPLKVDTTVIATLSDVAVVQADVNAHEAADGDLSATNELQTLSIDSTTVGSIERFAITISSGNTVRFNVPQADNWGSQVVETDATLTGDGTSGDPLAWAGASTSGPITGSGTAGFPLTILNNSISTAYTDTSIDNNLLPYGVSGYTLRHNGTSWIGNNYLQNTGSQIRINGANATIDTSYRLAVKQTGASTSTGGIAVYRSNSTNIAALYHNGSATFESIGGNNLTLKTASGSLINLISGGGGGQLSQVQIAPGANITATLGNAAIMNVYGTYAPTTSGGDFSAFRIGTNFNLTGAANQRVKGLLVTPTLTAITNGFFGVEYRPSNPSAFANAFLWQPVGAAVRNHLAGDLSVGTDTTLAAAKVQIQGDGATSSTYSLIVTNSGAATSTAALTVRDDSRVGVGTNAPVRALHVEGEARVSDLTTDSPTRIVGADADGDLGAITVGSGLSLSGGTLTASASATPGQTGETIRYSGTDTQVADSTLLNTGSLLAATVPIESRQTVAYTGDITPTALAANTDDWNPTGLSTASVIRISASGAYNLTGIQGGADGRFLYMYNVGENTITLKDNTTSTSAYQFQFAHDIELKAGQGIILQYDATNSKWRAAGSTTWAQSAVVYTYTTPQTNTAVTVPTGAKSVDILCVGAGGGGGSGRRGAAASIRSGGGGGGAGGTTFQAFTIADLGSPTTLYVNVGAGGTGGAARSTDNTDGANGTDGGDTDVRTSTASADRFIFAGGGAQGVGGDSDGAGAGSGAAATTAMFVGGTGGTSSVTGGTGASSNAAAFISGGGGGGGITSGDSHSNGGGAGSCHQTLYSVLAGGSAGGGNGNTRTVVAGRMWGQGGSGGGGNTGGTGGTGGNGIRGGGGGGGGASLNGNNSGAGGNGGDGLVRLIFYF